MLAIHKWIYKRKQTSVLKFKVDMGIEIAEKSKETRVSMLNTQRSLFGLK